MSHGKIAFLLSDMFHGIMPKDSIYETIPLELIKNKLWTCFQLAATTRQHKSLWNKPNTRNINVSINVRKETKCEKGNSHGQKENVPGDYQGCNRGGNCFGTASVGKVNRKSTSNSFGLCDCSTDRCPVGTMRKRKKGVGKFKEFMIEGKHQQLSRKKKLSKSLEGEKEASVNSYYTSGSNTKSPERRDSENCDRLFQGVTTSGARCFLKENQDTRTMESRDISSTHSNNSNMFCDSHMSACAKSLSNITNKEEQLAIQKKHKTSRWRRRASKNTANSPPAESRINRSFRDAATKSSASLWDGFQRMPTLPLSRLYIILTVACCAVYVNGLPGEYVHDDVSAVLRNPDVQGTTPCWRLFFNDFWGKSMSHPSSHKSYRPITILTFRLVHWLCGNAPIADHTLNLILHVCVTLLYAHTILSVLRLTYAHALVCGGFFAIHPVHTEAVTGIVGRADLLAALLFLVSFLAYHRGMEAPTIVGEWAWTWLSGVLACVGVFCKENAITVLAVSVLWDSAHRFSAIRSYMLGKGLPCDHSPLVRRIRRMVCLGIVVVFLRVMLMKGSAMFSEQDNPAAYNNNTLTRLQTLWYLPAHNVWLLLYPKLLSYDWQMGSIPLMTSPQDLRNIASLCLYVTLLLIFHSSFKAKESEGLAIFWSLLLLCLPFIPATNIFFTVGFVVAERLLYIPSLGWCTLVGLGAIRLSRLLTRKLTWRLLIFLFLVFSLRTIKRNFDWRSRETLFASGVRSLPENAKVHYNYANFLRDTREAESAIYHYKEAIRLWWSYPSAHNNLGTMLQQRGDADNAEYHFMTALNLHPNHPRASFNLATLWRQQGHPTQSINLLAPMFSPEEEEEEETGPDIGGLLAGLYLQQEKLKEAEDVHLSLAAAYPTNPSILADYGIFLQNLGRTEAAIRHFEAALSLNPSHKNALMNYAALSHTRHQHDHAYRLYSRALDKSWEVDTATALARVCILTNRLGEAEELLNDIILRHHPHLLALVYLAQVHLQQKQYRTSEKILRQVLEESPNHQEALYQLSLLYSASNRSQEAVEAAMEAARLCSNPKDVCAILHAHHADLLHTFTLVEAAITSYRLAVSLEPALIRAHLNLGAIYHTQGRYNLAWDHYTTALSHDPTNALLLENMEKLQRVSKIPTNR